MPTTRTRRVKAWAIILLNGVVELVYPTKAMAIWKRNRMIGFYKVIPCTITYQLPKTKKKDNKK